FQNTSASIGAKYCIDSRIFTCILIRAMRISGPICGRSREDRRCWPRSKPAKARAVRPRDHGLPAGARAAGCLNSGARQTRLAAAAAPPEWPREAEHLLQVDRDGVRATVRSA